MSELRNPICLMRLVMYSLKKRRLISGHDFTSAPYETPDNIHIIHCKTCGYESVAWSWGSVKDYK